MCAYWCALLSSGGVCPAGKQYYIVSQWTIFCICNNMIFFACSVFVRDLKACRTLALSNNNIR